MNLKEFEKVTLEKIEYKLERHIPLVQLRDLEVKSWIDDFTNSIVTEIKGFVYGRKVKKVVTNTVAYPSDWVQAVKERFLPKFLRKWFPINYKYIDAVTIHYHICPHINVASYKEHLDFLVSRTDSVTKAEEEV